MVDNRRIAMKRKGAGGESEKWDGVHGSGWATAEIESRQRMNHSSKATFAAVVGKLRVLVN